HALQTVADVTAGEPDVAPGPATDLGATEQTQTDHGDEGREADLLEHAKSPFLSTPETATHGSRPFLPSTSLPAGADLQKIALNGHGRESGSPEGKLLAPW